MNLCDENLCTGCGACAEICPKNCIKMTEDEYGFFYPCIDKNECVGCGLCGKTCPVKKNDTCGTEKKVYACWSKDTDERKSCTSGGMATVYSRKIIASGGLVYGSALTNKGICHIRVDKIDDLELLKGSKYVQSNMFNIYKTLKADVESGVPVLFIGTPCQCEGVKSVIGEVKNLYLVDLICTGVPPQKFLWENLGYKDCFPEKIRFRDETGTRLTVWQNGEIVYKKPSDKDNFLMGFAKHITFRKSCYSCVFASENRCSDITLGDFWGLGKNITFTENKDGGVSLVILNSDKGNELTEKVKESIFCQERTIEEAKNGNPRYYIPSNPHKKYQKFSDLYNKKGFKKALKVSLRKERLKYFAYKIAKQIKNLVMN